MNIDKQYLTISNYNRPGTRRPNTTAVACHYIGNPGTSAQANRNYFENLAKTHTTKASAHYIIGLAGEVIQMIPEEETSWCTNSANSYTISIEACHPDATGKFTDATYATYVELCADICQRWGLDPEHGGLIRHYDVTKKVCPKWFVDHTDAWGQFKRDVAAAMRKSGWKQEDGGWRYYLGTSGIYVANDWYKDGDKWYWFNDLGYMVHDDWVFYKEKWYFLNSDGSMAHDQWIVWKGQLYRVTGDGSMFEGTMKLKTDEKGALK